jgi:hypothetical protein
MIMPPDPTEQAVGRAARALARPGAWLDPDGADYALRQGPDRRRRPLMRLDEAVFAALTRTPGLRPRSGGGYVLARLGQPPSTPPAPGRPGVIEGVRTVRDGDGALRQRRVNLGESPIAWLAQRKDGAGAAWLTPREAAAGEKLREDFHKAGTIGRLTMDWSAGPRGRAGRGGGLADPVDRAIQAKSRVRAALEAVGPGLDRILELVCFRGSALDAAERDLGLPRRSGKAVLKLALQRLAIHYGI